MFEIDELAAIEMAIDRRMNKLNYEFDMLMQFNENHIATVIKDRTGKYQDEWRSSL